MSQIAETVRPKFETLSVDLKNLILERDEDITTIHDLIRVLEEIVAEEDS